MTEYTQIPVSSPEAVEVPVAATATKTYDKWWIKRIRALGEEANQPVSGLVILVKALKNQDGTWEFSPRPEDEVTMQIEDIFALAETDAELAATINSILGIVIRYATAGGLI